MSIYDFQAALIDGKPMNLSAYRGKVLLIVNTASQCGFSRQFAELQQLYESRSGQGFEILAFPCNQFNQKEPGSNPEVQQICQVNHGVTFPLFAKVDVRGPYAHPLFSYLTQQATFQGFDSGTKDGPWMDQFLREKHLDVYEGDGVKWNFSKFLINRNGHVVARFESTTEPLNLVPALDALL